MPCRHWHRYQYGIWGLLTFGILLLGDAGELATVRCWRSSSGGANCDASLPTRWHAAGRLSWWSTSRCHGHRTCRAVCSHVTTVSRRRCFDRCPLTRWSDGLGQYRHRRSTQHTSPPGHSHNSFSHNTSHGVTHQSVVIRWQSVDPLTPTVAIWVQL